MVKCFCKPFNRVSFDWIKFKLAFGTRLVVKLTNENSSTSECKPVPKVCV